MVDFGLYRIFCVVLARKVKTLMLPIMVMHVVVLSLQAVVEIQVARRKRMLEARQVGRAAVNLQTTSQSGNGVGQEASNLTTQVHLVIALKLISLSPFEFFLPCCAFCIPPPRSYILVVQVLYYFLKKKKTTDKVHICHLKKTF